METNKSKIDFSIYQMSEKDKRELHPWRRCFARSLDISITSAVVVLIIEIMVHRFNIPILRSFRYTIGLIIWSLLEIFILSIFGTTIGKSLFKIRIINPEGEKPNLLESTIRSFMVLYYGCGLGIPIIDIITKIRSKLYLEYFGKTRWDEFCSLNVLFDEIDTIKVTVHYIVISLTTIVLIMFLYNLYFRSV